VEFLGFHGPKVVGWLPRWTTVEWVDPEEGGATGLGVTPNGNTVDGSEIPFPTTVWMYEIM